MLSGLSEGDATIQEGFRAKLFFLGKRGVLGKAFARLPVYKLANCIVLYHRLRENTEEFVLV